MDHNKVKKTLGFSHISLNESVELDEFFGRSATRFSNPRKVDKVAFYQLYRKRLKDDMIDDIEKADITVYNDGDVDVLYRNADPKAKYSDRLGDNEEKIIRKELKYNKRLPQDIEGLKWINTDFFDKDLRIKEEVLEAFMESIKESDDAK